MKKIKLNDIEYELIDNKDGFDFEEVEKKCTDYFIPYDYIIGDWSYGSLRLKGFCDKDNKIYKKENDISIKEEYLKNNCAYGCKYFVLKKESENMKKGFTLVELLGVIVVVAILGIITIPSIIEQVRNKRSSVDEATEKLIYSSAELYLDYHSYTYPKDSGNHYCITLQTLTDEGSLEAPLKDAKGNEIDLSTIVGISVSSTEELTFEYDESDCKEVRSE